jgi:hypothetical protein
MMDFYSTLMRLITEKGFSEFIHPKILQFKENFKYFVTTVTNLSRIHEGIKNRLNL